MWALLGSAADSKNVAVMVTSTIVCELIRQIVQRASISSGFTAEKASKLSLCATGSVHALVACGLSLCVVLQNDHSAGVYDRIELAQTTFAISSGFFAWDVLIVLFVEFELAFLLHAVACLLCYVFGQYPFLNYWGVYFLLFELSTPLLHLRKLYLITGRTDSPEFPLIERMFGATFFASRILMGIPVSGLVWRDLLALLNNADQVHSHLVVYYYLVANLALCSLNVFWFVSMLNRRKHQKTA